VPDAATRDAQAQSPAATCEDVLAASRTVDQARCVHPPRCAQALREPDRILWWDLFIDEYVTDAAGNQVLTSKADLARRAACVAGWLEEQGQSRIKVWRDFATVSFVGTWGAASAVVTFRSVQGFEIGCTEESCAYCHDLPHDLCVADAFCMPVTGARADTVNLCWAPGPAGCLPSDRACTEGTAFALDGDGACWSFGSCVPDRLTRVSAPFAPDSPCNASGPCAP